MDTEEACKGCTRSVPYFSTVASMSPCYRNKLQLTSRQRNDINRFLVSKGSLTRSDRDVKAIHHGRDISLPLSILQPTDRDPRITIASTFVPYIDLPLHMAYMLTSRSTESRFRTLKVQDRSFTTIMQTISQILTPSSAWIRYSANGDTHQSCAS